MKEGYIILKCFTVQANLDTGEIELTCNVFLAWVFDMFFAPFWDGRVALKI